MRNTIKLLTICTAAALPFSATAAPTHDHSEKVVKTDTKKEMKTIKLDVEGMT